MKFTEKDYQNAIEKLKERSAGNLEIHRYYLRAVFDIDSKDETCTNANIIDSPLYRALE